jgi:ATP-dependent DNA helicase RecQ
VAVTATADLTRLAQDTFGWSDLTPEQLQAMEHVVEGHDVLVVLPTGAGKSAIYQVPALVLDGPTLVVSPLIALQHDQIGGIANSAAPRAVALNSAMSEGERAAAWEAVRDGTAEYLFLAPEQLADDERLEALAELGVSLFVVDEAHCVSGWGHDFRPDYLRLGPAIERLGHPRVLAMTATAAPPVRQDIVERLGLRDQRAVVAGFDRPNLRLSVERYLDDDEKRAAVVERVLELARGTGSGLLYVATRKDTDRYAEELAAAGPRVAGYHAGMPAAERDRVHRQFTGGELDVVVATSAFGMGIDRPDVRFVVHASAPESLDSYYQQIGRAGRDGEPAATVLCYRPEDLALQKFLTAARAPEEAVTQVVRVVGGHDEPVDRARLREEVDGSPARRTRAVNLLEQAGVLTTTEDGALLSTGEHTPEQAVAEALRVADAHQELIRSRIHMMRGYAETTGCRRQFLLGYFGEELPGPCGNCDNCAAGAARPRVPGTDEFTRNDVVRHVEWGRGVVMSVEHDRLTVLFDDVGYKTLSLDAVREQDLLAVLR